MQSNRWGSRMEPSRTQGIYECWDYRSCIRRITGIVFIAILRKVHIWILKFTLSICDVIVSGTRIRARLNAWYSTRSRISQQVLDFAHPYTNHERGMTCYPSGEHAAVVNGSWGHLDSVLNVFYIRQKATAAQKLEGLFARVDGPYSRLTNYKLKNSYVLLILSYH